MQQQVNLITAIITALVLIAGALAVMRAYFKRGKDDEWKKVAEVRDADRAECERKVAVLTRENEQLRAERDRLERQQERSLRESLQMHGRIEVLEREQPPRHRRPKDSNE